MIAKRYAITGPNDESKEADDLTGYARRLGDLLYTRDIEANNVSNAFRAEAKPHGFFGKVVLYQESCKQGDINTNIIREGPDARKVIKGREKIMIAGFDGYFSKDRITYSNPIMIISMDPKCPQATTTHLGIQ